MFKNVFHLPCRHPKNTNVVEGMVKALARVVSSVQVEVMFLLIFISSSLIVFCLFALAKVDIDLAVCVCASHILNLVMGHNL